MGNLFEYLSICEYLSTFPEYSSEIMPIARQSSWNAQEVWGLLENRVPYPSVAWGPQGTILFWWDMPEHVVVNLECTGEVIELMVLAGISPSDSDRVYTGINPRGAVLLLKEFIRKSYRYPSKCSNYPT